MTITTLLVDLDGVVLTRAAYFSERAKVQFPHADHAAITAFFTDGSYARAVTGEVDLPTELARVLPSWKIALDPHELLKMWFSEENEIDVEVLRRIDSLRTQGIKCVIATDHSAYRARDVWDGLRMRDHFDGIIASSDVGVTKEESEFFQACKRTLMIVDPTTLAFIDDDPKNVAVARECGLHAVVYADVSSFDELEDRIPTA
jgi:HAD superfamily hydrolase (TIGR01509 family)